MAYLIDHPPVRDQFDERTRWSRSRLTGLTVLHTTEFPPSWTVTEQAAWICRRSDPGSYHDIADTYGDDLCLIPYRLGAYHDATGSNGFATSISFVCRTTDWGQMPPEQRRRTLRAGARAFVRQQAWRKTCGHPLTELRLISKAQSDRGESGFIYHGLRDPGRRTDPGVSPPNEFPLNEFIAECRAALGGTTPSQTVQEDDDMKLIQSPGRGIAAVGPGYYKSLTAAELGVAVALYGKPNGDGSGWSDAQFDLARSVALNGMTTSSTAAQLGEAVAKLSGLAGADVDEEALAAALAPKLSGTSKADIADALRQVLRDGVGA